MIFEIFFAYKIMSSVNKDLISSFPVCIRFISFFFFFGFTLAAAAKSLQWCLTLCDPIDSSHQAPPSLGFSRQEHWSGLPFPSPMRESEVAQLCPTFSDPIDGSPPGSSAHGLFQARVLEQCHRLLCTLARVCYIVLKSRGGSLILFLFLILEGNKASVFSPGSRMLAVGLL